MKRRLLIAAAIVSAVSLSIAAWQILALSDKSGAYYPKDGLQVERASREAVDAESPPPKLLVDPRHLEDPALLQDPQKLKELDCVFEYVLHNQGKGVLKISNVIRSCGCMAHSLGSDELAPGDSTVLSIRVARSWNLERTVSVTCDTNDPTASYVRLTARVAARNGVPHLAGNNLNALNFGVYAQPGDKRTIDVSSYENKGEEWLRVESAELTGMSIAESTVKEEQTDFPTVVLRKHQIVVRINEDAEAGQVRGMIKFAPLEPRDEADEHLVRVSGEVCAVLAFPRVLLVPRSGSEEIGKEVRLVSLESWALTASSDAILPGVTIDEVPGDEKHVRSFLVKLMPDILPSDAQELTFQTNHPLAQCVRVKFLRYRSAHTSAD